MWRDLRAEANGSGGGEMTLPAPPATSTTTAANTPAANISSNYNAAADFQDYLLDANWEATDPPSYHRRLHSTRSPTSDALARIAERQ